MTESMTKSQSSITYAGLFRRLFAIFYDCFLLIAILFIVTAIANALNQGEAIEPGDTLYPLYVLTIFILSYLYFAWFWIHGGQTLGMKRSISALFSWGLFGAGFLLALFDKNSRCWHDLASKTVLIDLR